MAEVFTAMKVCVAVLSHRAVMWQGTDVSEDVAALIITSTLKWRKHDELYTEDGGRVGACMKF
jgi:hypothetical protein